MLLSSRYRIVAVGMVSRCVTGTLEYGKMKGAFLNNGEIIARF